MKTCKMGCGKMKSGGTIKKVKKMALGGSATNKLNNPKAPTKPTRGGGNIKMGIYGVPNAGRTDALGFKKGGSTTSKTLKPVPPGKTGLAKLPTAVRNKMGFQKKGGAVKKKK